MCHQVALWKHALPTVRPYYAIKCNPEPLLLHWLSQRGVGFDCASAREILLALQSGSTHQDIVYANPCKKEDDILSGANQNIKTTVIDSHDELHKLQELGWKGDSLLRLRVDDEGSTVRFGEKFGCEFSELRNLAAYAALKRVKLCGISFHVGSGCKNPRLYRTAIQKAVEGCKILKEEGHATNTSQTKQIIDIGGGFSSDASVFQGAAAEISAAIAEAPPSLQWIAEPGRFFAAPAQDFFVRVIGKKPSSRGSAAGWRYTLDDSLYGQFSCIPFDQARPIWIRVRSSEETRRPRSRGILYGRTCDSVDMIATAHEMEELEVGDWLWFPQMGAYTTVTATEFNGFPRPHVQPIESHSPSQLPPLTQFLPADLPSGVQYVSPVKTPTLE